MKVLVIAREPISADRLSSAAGGTIDDAEIMIVAPAHRSALHSWFSDADDAIRRAELVQLETLKALDDAGLHAHGHTCERDPVTALAAVLVTFLAERILLFTRSVSEQRYDESVGAVALQQQFGSSVQQAE
jgi:hypothetical protein